MTSFFIFTLERSCALETFPHRKKLEEKKNNQLNNQRVNFEYI